jgi:acyl carrier protein
MAMITIPGTSNITTTAVGDTETRVRAIVRRVARLEGDYSAGADLFRDLGVKSIAALDLLLSLEEEFGVRIPDEKFGEARSVTALVALLEALR